MRWATPAVPTVSIVSTGTAASRSNPKRTYPHTDVEAAIRLLPPTQTGTQVTEKKRVTVATNAPRAKITKTSAANAQSGRTGAVP